MSDEFSRIRLASGDLKITWAALTDRGRRRENNQDAVLAQFPLFVVADGMGGHIGGEIASSSAITRLRDVAGEGKVSQKTIEKALSLAISDITEHTGDTDEGTGTTVTGIFFMPGGKQPQWVVMNIGDSRVYLSKNGQLTQLTTDHSVVQELVAAGRLTPEEAENHPYGNVITRALGPSERGTPDYVRVDATPGDRFVICSDGLTKELTDYGVQHFLNLYSDPQEAVDAMLATALENGGRDNISIIVVNVDEVDA